MQTFGGFLAFLGRLGFIGRGLVESIEAVNLLGGVLRRSLVEVGKFLLVFLGFLAGALSFLGCLFHAAADSINRTGHSKDKPYPV